MFALVRFGFFSISKYLATVDVIGVFGVSVVNVIKVPGVSAARAVGDVESDVVKIKMGVMEWKGSIKITRLES